MINPDNQIFDLLPGEFNLHSPQHQSEADDGIDNPYFGIVFTDLLGMVKPTDNTTSPLNGEEASVGEESLLLSPVELIAEAPSQVAFRHGDDLQIPQVLSNIISELPHAVVAKTIPGQPVGGLATGEYVNTMLSSQQPLYLEPGTYKILDSSLQGDVLHVTVANDSDKSNTFGISIPLEQLKLSMAPRVMQIPGQNPAEQHALTVKQPKSRIDLNVLRNGAQIPVQQESLMGPELRLEQYLSKLNLKAIEIMPDSKPMEIESPSEAIRLTIIADDAGQKIVIRSYRIEKDLHVWREGNSGGLKEGRVQRCIGRMVAEGDNAAAKAQADTVTNSPQVFTKITPSSGNQYRFHDDFSLENLKVSGDRNESSSALEKVETYTVFEKLIPDADVGNRRLDIQPVRFTLPDSIKTSLKPNGQTVMLRIEPEHLGSAKLSLTMYNDKLQARVIVNNIPAKIAVEASLHRLVEQLSQANIEVDHIEVTIGGESAHDGIFGRRPQWRYHANRFGRFNLDKVFNSGQQATVPARVPQSASYVGADGVNLLA
jgi:hypothetical protein